MNPAEETNLRAEVAALRALVKLLIGHLPDDAATGAALEATAKAMIETAPPFTHERVAMQRAFKLIDPTGIPRKPASS